MCAGAKQVADLPLIEKIFDGRPERGRSYPILSFPTHFRNTSGTTTEPSAC